MNHDLDFNSHSAINLKTPRQQQNDAISYQFFEDNFLYVCMEISVVWV